MKCWLCRMIGHKWMTERKYRMGDLSTSNIVMWPLCIRCGAPCPEKIVQAWAHQVYAKETEKGGVANTE